MSNPPEKTIEAPKRWQDPGLPLESYADEFLVECPRCGQQARTARAWNKEHGHWDPAALTCTDCGLSRQADARLHCSRCPIPPGSGWVGPAMLSARCRCARCGVWLEAERRLRVPPKEDWVALPCETCAETTRSSYSLRAVPLSSAAVDLCFGLPLWLNTTCAGHTLWAFNAAHLDLLRAYISAMLREGGPYSGSVGARLPSWLKRAKRTTVLRALSALELRLAK